MRYVTLSKILSHFSSERNDTKYLVLSYLVIFPITLSEVIQNDFILYEVLYTA